MKTKALAAVFAILAAALYAINVPLSKLLLEHVGTTMMAAFLYLGAGESERLRGDDAVKEDYGKEAPNTEHRRGER